MYLRYYYYDKLVYLMYYMITAKINDINFQNLFDRYKKKEAISTPFLIGDRVMIKQLKP